MAETVAAELPSAQEVAQCAWLPEDELAVYAGEFGRTGFQGGLQWYRSVGNPGHLAQFLLFSGRSIDVPSCYVAGASDWGIYQRPGDFESMQNGACADIRSCHLIERAVHWVQQEQPEVMSRVLTDFLNSV